MLLVTIKEAFVELLRVKLVVKFSLSPGVDGGWVESSYLSLFS